jgi:hypothetical protein
MALDDRDGERGDPLPERRYLPDIAGEARAATIRGLVAVASLAFGAATLAGVLRGVHR